MKINLEKLTNSRMGLLMAIAVARGIPHWMGYPITEIIARIIASRRSSELVKAVRLNQWMVSGQTLTKYELNQAVLSVFENNARSIYDLYHYLQNPNRAVNKFIFDESVHPFVGRPEFAERGLIVAGLHSSGFDLALQLICLKWLKPFVLTIPNPVGGRHMEFEIRKRTGMNLVPADLPGLRKAIRHLEKGGLIVTGMDRPGLDYPLRPRFFNHPSALPTHYIYLAVKTHTPIMIVVARLESDGKYHISASPPIEMDSYPDRQEEQLRNAEKVLSVAETFIRRAPTQWSITKPVWPEAMSQVPAPAQVPGFFSISRG